MSEESEAKNEDEEMIFPENIPWICKCCSFENDSIQTLDIGKFYCLVCFTWKENEAEWGCSYENCGCNNPKTRKKCIFCARLNRMTYEPKKSKVSIELSDYNNTGRKGTSSKRARSQQHSTIETESDQSNFIQASLPISAADIAYSVSGRISQPISSKSSNNKKKAAVSSSSSSSIFEDDNVSLNDNDNDNDYDDYGNEEPNEFLVVKEIPPTITSAFLQRDTSRSSRTITASLVDSSSTSTSEKPLKSNRASNSSGNVDRAFAKFKMNQLLLCSPDKSPFKEIVSDQRFASFSESQSGIKFDGIDSSSGSSSSESILPTVLATNTSTIEVADSSTQRFDKALSLIGQLNELQHGMFESQQVILQECIKSNPQLLDIIDDPLHVSTSISSSSNNNDNVDKYDKSIAADNDDITDGAEVGGND